jgi:ABC-2 type transport system permease protein
MRRSSTDDLSPRTTASVAVLRTEALLFAREPGAVFWVLVFPSLLLLAFGLIPAFREANPQYGGRRIIEFYVPATVLVAIITASLQTMPAAVVGYRERGILRRLRTTPARPADLLAAQVLLHAVAAVLSAALVVLLGRLVFGVGLPRSLPAYALTLVSAVLAGTALGALITSVARTAKAAAALGLAVFFPAMFTAGIYVPIPALPQALRRLIEYTPFGAASQALDQATVGGGPAWHHLTVLALWTVVALVAAARWFRWE